MASIEQSQWEKRINANYRACGCGSAALALVTTTLALGTIASVDFDLFVRRPVMAGGLTMIALFASFVVGKAIGLTVAHLRLKGVVSSLRRRLA